jgi:hypothetical protein
MGLCILGFILVFIDQGKDDSTSDKVEEISKSEQEIDQDSIDDKNNADNGIGGTPIEEAENDEEEDQIYKTYNHSDFDFGINYPSDFKLVEEKNNFIYVENADNSAQVGFGFI